MIKEQFWTKKKSEYKLNSDPQVNNRWTWNVSKQKDIYKMLDKHAPIGLSWDLLCIYTNCLLNGFAWMLVLEFFA